MNQEEYQELNHYLNQIFAILEKQNPVALEYLGSFCQWAEIFYCISDDRRFDNLDTSFCTVSFPVFYNELKEFLHSINPLYAVKLDEALQNGMLNLGEDVEESKYDSTSSITIDIQREYTWKDAIVCIHEFFHYLNDSDSLNHDILTEGISIYFEFLFYDYLINKGIPIDFPVISNRIVSTYYIASDFMKYSLEFLLFKEIGDLDALSYQYIPTISPFKLTKGVYDQECAYLLKKCRNIEEEYLKKEGSKEFHKEKFEEEVRDNFLYEYQYIMGTFLALYMRRHSSTQKMVWLNENVGQDCSVTTLLKKIGIDVIDFDTGVAVMDFSIKEEMQRCLWEEVEKNSVPFKKR